MVKATIELLFAPIILAMQQARRLLLYVLTLTVVLMLGSLRGWPQAPPPSELTVTLGIEVRLPDREIFYIPVVGDGEILGIVPFPNGPLAGIRITPRMRSDLVKIEVSGLAGGKKKLLEATCDEVRLWKSEDAGTCDGKKDESLVLSGLGRLGLPVFEVKVVQAYGPPPSGFRHATPILLPSATATSPNPDPSSSMGGPLAEWRGLRLILMQEGARRLVDAVSAAGWLYQHRCSKHR
jgi:hypothetical protein